MDLSENNNINSNENKIIEKTEDKNNSNSNNNKINDNNSEKNENKDKSDSKIKESSENFMDDDYDYMDDYDEIDHVEEGQEEVLETMFINAKNSNENQLSLYLDIIGLDESKEKIWSYKCYQEICLIYLQFEDHYMFPLYYKELMKAARTFDPKKLRLYVEESVTVFLNEIIKHSKESINHWLEDLTSDFNRFEQDKVINMFEANINLKFLILSKGGNINNNKIPENESSSSNELNNIDVNIIDYLMDKEKLENLTNDYLIKECGCNPQYLDKRGNTFFYYAPENCRRGGEVYNVPVGWTAFGLEVRNKYGDDLDWLGNDGNPGEWAVAYHGFGVRMAPDQIKKIIKTIVHENLKPGSGQACSAQNDRRHPGKKCGNGVYTTPDLNIASGYAGLINLGNKQYRLVIMVRVNPSFIREPVNTKDYWILDGKANQLRPYRLLIREANSIKLY